MTFRVLGWLEWGKPSHHTWFGQVTCPHSASVALVPLPIPMETQGPGRGLLGPGSLPVPRGLPWLGSL